MNSGNSNGGSRRSSGRGPSSADGVFHVNLGFDDLEAIEAAEAAAYEGDGEREIGEEDTDSDFTSSSTSGGSGSTPSSNKITTTVILEGCAATNNRNGDPSSSRQQQQQQHYRNHRNPKRRQRLKSRPIRQQPLLDVRAANLCKSEQQIQVSTYLLISIESETVMP